jgi:bacterioferritin-associated ferredoxin
MAVMYSDIVQSIDSGNDSYEKLQEALLVGTGCNSCVEEVHTILKEELINKNK